MKILVFYISFYLVFTVVHLGTSTEESEDDPIQLDSNITEQLGEEVVKAWMELARPVHEECNKESGFDGNFVLESLKNAHISNPKIKACGKCLFERLGFLDSENNFNSKLMSEKIAGQTEEMTEKCVKQTRNEKLMDNKVYKVIFCSVRLIAQARSASAQL